MFRKPLASLFAAVLMSAACAAAARADGLIVISNPPPTTVRGHFSFAPLEVTYHKVDVKITDQLAETKVDQEFYNPNGTVLEGDYIFPVPLNTTIDKFTMDIDGKPVAAELLPADKARGIYNEIVRKAKDPALLEYAGRDMFRVHIFPIEAHGKKHVTISYKQLVKSDNGLLDYHYTLNTEKYSAKPLQNVSIKLTVDSSEPITTIYSPTHEIDKVLHGDKSATVGYEAKNVRPDHDFHVFIGRKSTPVGINMLSYRPDPDKPGYYVLLASPTVNKDVKALPKDVVFVMDTSGSMAGDKIEQARKALKYCIDTLNPQDRFDVVRFSTEAEPLFSGLKDANADNRKKATDYAGTLQAAGGTAIEEAILKGLSERDAKDPNRLFMVVFMTDGQPTVGEQNAEMILKREQAAANGAQVRIFTFGVGTDVNTKLLDLMAQGTRGYSQYVLPNENLELSMSSFWGKVQDPIIANLKVDTGNIAVAKSYPKEMPDLFKGDQLVVFGTYDKPGKGAVTLTGMVNGKEQKFSQDVVFEEKTDASKEWIAKLWATRRVGYLLDEIRLRGESKELKDEVVELARRWGVVTPYTAMLIIEDERARGVPLAERSLREMEVDRLAVGNSSTSVNTLRRGEAAGGQAVANAVNTNAYRQASNLDEMKKDAEQTELRMQVDSTRALAKAPDALAPALPTNVGGSGSFGGDGFAGGGGGGGARGGAGGAGAAGRGGRGGATGATGTPVTGSGAITIAGAGPATAAVTVKELNLGSQTANGWQTKQNGEKAEGYRVVDNYAQQTRTINNRSFFLNGNQWMESSVQNAAKEAKHVRVIFNSDEYFSLITRFPDAAQYLSLGSNVTLELGGTIYDIVEEAAAPEAR
jgi:Ca-activated chloride channel family protein